MALNDLMNLQPSAFPTNPQAQIIAAQVEQQKRLAQQQALNQFLQQQQQEQQMRQQLQQANIAHLGALTDAEKQNTAMAPHIAAMQTLHQIDPHGTANLLPEYARSHGFNIGTSPVESAVASDVKPEEIGQGPGQFATFGAMLPVLRQRIQADISAKIQKIMAIPDVQQRAQQYDLFKGQNQQRAEAVGITLPEFDRLNMAAMADETKRAVAEEQARQREEAERIKTALAMYLQQQRSQDKGQDRAAKAETERMRREMVKAQQERNYWMSVRRADESGMQFNQRQQGVQGRFNQREQDVQGRFDARTGANTAREQERIREFNERLRASMLPKPSSENSVRKSLQAALDKATDAYTKWANLKNHPTPGRFIFPNSDAYVQWKAELDKRKAELDRTRTAFNAGITGSRAVAAPAAQPASASNPIGQAIRDRKKALSDPLFE